MSEPISHDDRDQLAAEYALGVLDAADRRRVEAMAERDAAFADQVAAWEMRLAPLVDEVAPVPPPAAMWSRIDTLISPAPHRTSRPTAGVAFWRWLSFGSMGLAAASIATAVLITQAPAPAPLQVAALSAPDGQSLFTVVIDPPSGQATLVPQAAWATPGRVPELWLVPPTGATISMGVFDPARPARVTVPRAVIDAVSAGVTLAVSVEPPGGSPTGQATGPVIAVGKVTTL